MDMEHFKNTYKDNDDFIIRKVNINKNNELYLLFFESLCNSQLIYEYVLKSINNFKVLNQKIRNIESIIYSPKLKNITTESDCYTFLENGFCLIIFNDKCYAIEVKADIDRGITNAQTEPSMYGAKDAFCENYQKNLGVLKRRVKNKSLKIDSFEKGSLTKTKVSIIYLEDIASRKAVDEIKNKIIMNIKIDGTDSYDLSKELKQNKVFPTILKTEKPGIAAKYILKGYVLVMIDNTPFVLIMDAKLSDFVNPFTTDKFVKVLRYICLILTILTPAIYIALINFNQEAIPIDLLVNFTEQRDTVPFPAVIEALIMLFTCEVLRESDIRFPNSYGSAASILGTLVIGEAAINAGIVSAIMVIIIAITFITNLIFNEIKLVWAIRILRISFLLIASFLGLYGISIAIIAALAIIANVKMYDGEYI